MPSQYKNQDYSSIKKKCVGEGTLFEDPEFPASTKSLFHSDPETGIEWLRPKELCRVPKLVVEGLSSDDLVHDDVTRSWFATACMALANESKLWHKVVPDSVKQEWDDKNQYAGIFKFHICRFGKWLEVVVDDRLPTKDGKLIYCRSSSKNEFWSALLEKAYAKLYGDYQSMANGEAGDAVVDFTGGVCEKIQVASLALADSTAKTAVFSKMKEASENRGLMSCVIVSDPTLVGASGPLGLVKGQGYNITMVKEIKANKSLESKLGTNNLRLLRLFAPNCGSKWTGPWSPKSDQMRLLSTAEWEKLGIKYEKEEEFWISFQEFISNFTDISICHFLNTSFFSLKKQWHESVLFSSWTDSGLCGGSSWDNDNFMLNPQFMFDIVEENGTAVVSLEQRDVKGDGISAIESFNSIGFYILKVEQNRKYRIHIKGDRMFKSEFFKSRSSYGQTSLVKGRYVVVPCCERKGDVGMFMLRLYAHSNPGCVELKKECPDSGCCRPKFKLVTTIEVIKADGLDLPANEKGSLDPFIVIVCEGQKVTSNFQKNTASPAFNTRATFYRKNPSKNIIVEVYNRNRVINSFLGEARIDIPGGEAGTMKVFDIYGRKKEADIQKPGKIYVNIRSSTDLAML